MTRQKSENFLDYKKRVIDSKSPSFCGAKWLNASIWLGTGTTSSCHLPPAHAIDLNEIKENPSALHNTKQKKEMRAEMQLGKFPKECDYCWKIENMQTNSISDRVFKTHQFDDLALQQVFEMNPKLDSSLQSLEIGFDRVCQMACSYCSPALSSSWSQDIKKNGNYKNLKSDGAEHFQHTGDQLYKYKDEQNPYLKAFWDWWPELKNTLRTIRVTGGEPLLSLHFWKLISELKACTNKNLSLSVNTNLMVPNELIEKLILETKDLSQTKIYTSAEAFGAQAEYIRDGLDYVQWKQNILIISEASQFESVNIMMTVNALCLFSLSDFLDDVLLLKQKINKKNYLTISLNILRFPSFQSALVLSDALKHKFHLQLKHWCELHFKTEFLNESEKENLLRLSEYLKKVEQPHEKASPNEILQQDFKQFYLQYDQRRGFDISKTFGSEFTQWFNSIVIS